MMANPFQGDDVDPFSGVRDEEGNIKREAPKEDEDEPKKTFKQAFAQARKDGDKTFMFNGKKYTTELKSEKKTPSKPAVEPKSDAPKNERVRKLGVFGAMGKNPRPANPSMFKKGGSVKSSASKRADGIAMKGKTRGRMV
jgi:hypothetical protein